MEFETLRLLKTDIRLYSSWIREVGLCLRGMDSREPVFVQTEKSPIAIKCGEWLDNLSNF